MLCQNCGEREARISITQIINNVKTQIHLCQRCAQQSGQADSVSALQKMLAGLVDWGSESIGKGKTCPGCGLSELELRHRGVLAAASVTRPGNPWSRPSLAGSRAGLPIPAKSPAAPENMPAPSGK